MRLTAEQAAIRRIVRAEAAAAAGLHWGQGHASFRIAARHRQSAVSLREPQVGGSVIDVLVRPDVSFDKLIANATIGELFGRRVSIAAIDDLLAMKRIANRPKDRLDIEALEKIKRGEDPNA